MDSRSARKGRVAAELEPPRELVVAGRITTVHGVKGWLKIHSFTAPESNIFDYQPWWMKFPDGWKKLEVDQFRTVTKGFIAHIAGLDDRDEARLYCQRDIQVSPDVFPPASDGEVYWRDLLNLDVVSRYGGVERLLGKVDGLMETGANDVLVVRPTPESIDSRERLVPYIADFVVDVNMETGRVTVDWDPDFELGDD